MLNTSTMSVSNKTQSTSKPVEPMSKVTFSPLNSEAILVSIKTVAPKPGEVMEPQRRSGSLDSRRQTKLLRSSSEKNLDKSTMTDYKREISVASQTTTEQPPPSSVKTDNNIVTRTLCVKHAAENISLKASDMPNEKLSLCNNCSKSMLSYIFGVQDFLDSLTKEICGNPESCAQCMKEEYRQQMFARNEEAAIAQNRPEKKVSSARRKSRESERHDNSKTTKDSRSDKIAQSSGSSAKRLVPMVENRQSQDFVSYIGEQSTCQPVQNVHIHHNEQQKTDYSLDLTNQPNTKSIHHPDGVFIKPMEREQPYKTSNEQFQDASDVFRNPESVTSPFREASEGLISSLTNSEREVYDSARNGAGFENLTETYERLVAPDGRILNEAYVTLCRNNAEALGCLVVGTSILLTQTKRTLCVLVSDGVSMAFRETLSAIFNTVQTVRQLDSLGTTKLALLEQPELGISFDKLNVWRLKQFHKCVYLNPDTLVVQNCDELFDREELSAVPDIGWPDCFNSGVFVFRPSDHTFWQLLEFSDKPGNGEGGDQGLLNSYFSSWNNDINKKLSFIYNLMANVSYTYTPAFKQFGKDIKIIQFYGTAKPWHVKFFNVTGLISPTSNVHPTYAEFVNKWIKIFRGNALRQLSQEIQAYAGSQELLSAVELLRFFPLPTESESEFFLTPVSVRLPLTEMKLQRTAKPKEEVLRRKSAEFHRHSRSDIEEIIEVKDLHLTEPDEKEEESSTLAIAESESEDSTKNEPKDMLEVEENDDKKLPGAQVGDYQGMQKWEQGKMDYQGKDSSDSVVKRLNFLMSQTK